MQRIAPLCTPVLRQKVRQKCYAFFPTPTNSGIQQLKNNNIGKRS